MIFGFVTGCVLIYLGRRFVKLIPEGYQDKHGFHYGKPPAGWVPDEFS